MTPSSERTPGETVRAKRAYTGLMRALPAVLGFALAALLALPVGAQNTIETTPEELALARRAHDFAEQNMSPFCPGRTLADCPSPSAKALRDRVRRMMATGLTETDIAAQLRREFGDVVLPMPDSPFVWVFPTLLIASGAILLGVVLVRLRRSERALATPRIDADLERELDEELRARGLDQDDEKE